MDNMIAQQCECPNVAESKINHFIMPLEEHQSLKNGNFTLCAFYQKHLRSRDTLFISLK